MENDFLQVKKTYLYERERKEECLRQVTEMQQISDTSISHNDNQQKQCKRQNLSIKFPIHQEYDIIFKERVKLCDESNAPRRTKKKHYSRVNYIRVPKMKTI